MILIQVDETTAARRRIPIYCVDVTDGMSPEVGEAAGQPQLSKNGAAHGNTSATLVAISNGDYYVELTAGEVDTLGFGVARYKSANTAEAKTVFQVVAFDPYDAVRMGLTALPNAAADAAGGLPISDAGGLDVDEFAKDRQFILDMIEHQRGEHTVQGSIFYVDPVNGNTHASGARGGRADPYDSVQDCHDNAITTYAHDCIILVAGHASAQTVLTEQITISKSHLMIRGPGRGFTITYGSPGDTITVTGNGVELSGFLADTAATGTSDAIVIQGDFCLVHHVWVDSARSDGVSIESADWCFIEDCFFNSSGNGAGDAGIRIGGTSSNTYINRVFIRNQTGSGIVLAGTVDHTAIQYSDIDESSVYGVDVTVAGVNDTMIWQCFMHDNTSGDVNDSGTGTHRENSEQWAKHSIATETRLAEFDAANLPTDIDAILADTGTDGVKIGADAISAASIADNAISAEHINTGALTADAFAADAIVAATFATDSISADAIAADAATEIGTSLLAQQITAGGVSTISDILLAANALARGRVVKAGSDYLYYDDDNVTLLFTLTLAAAERTTA